MQRGLTFVRYAPHKYGRLVLVRRSRSTHKGIFRCTCGAEKEIAFCAVYQGKTRSCGCLQREYLARLSRNNRENYRAFKAQLIPLSDGLHLSKEERCRAFNFKAAFKAPVPVHGDARPGDPSAGTTSLVGRVPGDKSRAER